MESAQLVRAHLIDVVGPTLFDDPAGQLTTHSTPGDNLPDDVMSVGAQRFDLTKPTLGTNRSREEVVETDVTFSCYRAGDDTAQPLATAAAFGMALKLDEYLRTGDGPKMGGATYDAWTTGGELTESKVVPPAGGGTGVTGRLATLVVTITTKARR